MKLQSYSQWLTSHAKLIPIALILCDVKMTLSITSKWFLWPRIDVFPEWNWHFYFSMAINVDLYNFELCLLLHCYSQRSLKNMTLIFSSLNCRSQYFIGNTVIFAKIPYSYVWRINFVVIMWTLMWHSISLRKFLWNIKRQHEMKATICEPQKRWQKSHRKCHSKINFNFMVRKKISCCFENVSHSLFTMNIPECTRIHLRR